MGDSNTVVKAGDCWGALSTGWKCRIGFAFVSLLIGAFGGGYWLGRENTAARYEKHIVALEREMSKLRNFKETKTVGIAASVSHAGDDLPALAEGAADPRTMTQFAQQVDKHRQEHRGRTAIQTPDFHAMSKGRKFTCSASSQMAQSLR